MPEFAGLANYRDAKVAGALAKFRGALCTADRIDQIAALSGPADPPLRVMPGAARRTVLKRTVLKLIKAAGFKALRRGGVVTLRTSDPAAGAVRPCRNRNRQENLT